MARTSGAGRDVGVKPLARAGVIVRSIGDEVVVYDHQSHVAHCLNRTAALVFQNADGHRSVRDLAALLSGGTGDLHDDLVRETLERLAAANLLESAPLPVPERPSRREVLRQVGLGVAVLAPVVASLLVPTPAEAAATCIPQASCTLAKYGQPCWVGSMAECPTKICTDANQCQ